MLRVRREEITIEQADWEQRRQEEVRLEQIDEKRFVLHGVNMRNFHDLVGPELSYKWLARTRRVEIIEPTLLEKAKSVARNLIGRVAT